jgi:amidase
LRELTRQQLVYSLDRNHPPALTIESGETVRLETFDARSGTIVSETDLLDHRHPLGHNPATGPIAVENAEPGDSLAVEILDIRLADSGFLAVKDGVGLLGEKAVGYTTRIVPIRDGRVYFSDRIHFPTRPMVGVIGTAPDGEGVDTGLAGPHGGNMDNRYITTGAVVHLPVGVSGALLGIGDVHASMGDGEITMIGLEICAEVTVRIHLHRNIQIKRPWIETAEHWVTTGDNVDPAQALRIAADEMCSLLQSKLGLSFHEAYMLMSARGDVQICQICEPGDFPVTTRAVFPKIPTPSGEGMP